MITTHVQIIWFSRQQISFSGYKISQKWENCIIYETIQIKIWHGLALTSTDLMSVWLKFVWTDIFISERRYISDVIFQFLNYVIDTDIYKDDGKVILVQTKLSVLLSSPSMSNFYLNLENNTVFCHLRMFFRENKAWKVLFAVNLLCIWSLQPVPIENCIMISSSSNSCMTSPNRTL